MKKIISLFILSLTVCHYTTAQQQYPNSGIQINNPNGKTGVRLFGDGAAWATNYGPGFLQLYGSRIYDNGNNLHFSNGATRINIHSGDMSSPVTIKFDGQSNSYFNIGNLGVGTTSPYTKLHVRQGVSGVSSSHTNGLTVENNSHAGINIFSPNNMMGRIYFGDPESNIIGSIEYVHDGDYMKFRTSNTERFRISSGGFVGIGETNPSHILHVKTSSGAVGLFQSTSSQAYLRVQNAEGYNKRVEFTNRPGGRATIWVSGYGDAINVLPNNGFVGVGTTSPQSKLAVNGQIRATEVKVLADISVPDYVFEPDYELRTLKETKEYISENKHLPEIPSAAEIGENGIDLGDMNMRLLKKIEELTLYQIELLEKVEELQSKVEKLENE